VKTVKIYDPLLATLHYSFMIAIFVYIAVIQVTKKNGYLQFEDPIGSARLSVQPPTVNQCDPDDPGCHFDYLPTTELPYCTGYKGTDKATTNIDCMYMGALEANFPVTGGSPFYLSTRVRESNQTLTCRDPSSQNDQVCQQTYMYACNNSFKLDSICAALNSSDAKKQQCWGNEPYCWAQRSYFVPQVEEFTLLLDHAVRASNGVTAGATKMLGVLKYCNGTEIVPTLTDQGIGFYVIKDLLEAANVGTKCSLKLDDPSVVAYSKHTARYDGVVLQIQLDYRNSKPWGGVLPNGQVEYVMTTSIVNGTKSKIEQELWWQYPTQRVTRDRHGIKILVIQSGQLGAFSAAALLTTLTGSLALLAVATTGVDFLAMYVLARKSVYKQAKYQVIDERYLEQKEEEEARLESNAGQRWSDDYNPPRDGRVDSEPLTGNSSRVAPYGTASGAGTVNEFQWQ